MAPISAEPSTSSKSSSSTSSSKMSSCQCGHQPASSSRLFFDLPISRKGHFFQDSFFDNSYDSLDSTIRRIMEGWGATDLLADRRDDTKHRLSNNLSRYRQMRSHNLKEEDQAVTVASDTTSHKIVMDVSEFVSGKLKVQVTGEREVTVEGHTETNTGGFSMSSNSFRRKFNLPQDTNMEAITSVMSSDGVLTITAPRRVQQVTNEGTSVPITAEGSLSNQSTVNSHSSATSQSTVNSQTNSTSSANTRTTSASTCQCQSVRQEDEAQSSGAAHKREHRIPINVEAALSGKQQQQQQSVAGGTAHAFKDINNSNSDVVNENTGNERHQMKQNIQSNEHKKKNLARKTEQVQTSSHTTSVNHPVNSQGNAQTTDKSQNTAAAATSSSRNISFNLDSFLPITKKGNFFEDSYFEEIQKDFQNAVNEVLASWGEDSFMSHDRDNTSDRLTNNLNRYRQIRAQDQKIDNQAINTNSDVKSHKIVMDVHDFAAGEVKVRVVGEREVVVEGRKETQDGDFSVSSNTFRRRFCLPQDSNMDAITSVMSSDGVLTVIVPRIVKTTKTKENFVPIIFEGKLSTDVAGDVRNNSSETTPIKTEKEIGSNKIQQHVESTFHKDTRNSPQMAAADSTGCQQNTRKFSAQCSTQTESEVGRPAETHTGEEIMRKCEEAMKSSKSENVSQVSVASHAHSVQDNKSVSTQSSRPATLPVTTRGGFFTDSFFKDTWQDFQEAVRDVVSRWGDVTSNTDDLTSYRRLRARDLRDETQAVKTSEDEVNYKIVVDVQDFIQGGNINVSSANDREVVVEGQVERVEGGAKFRKQFHRRFVLPQHIYVESVTSVRSSDGVLVITAPKKPVTPKIRETIIPVSIEEGIHKSESLTQVSEENTRKKTAAETATETSEISSRVEEEVQRSESKEVSSLAASSSESTSHQELHSASLSHHKVTGRREHIIPISLEEEEETTTESHQREYSQSLSCDSAATVTQEEELKRKNIQQSFATDENVAHSNICQSVNESAVESGFNSNIVDQQISQQKSHSENVQSLSVSQSESVSGVSEHKESSHGSSCVTQNKCVPIAMKGDFFSDSFFENTRKNFTNAVQEVLKNSEEKCIHSDELTSYRSLLRRNPKLENQAVHVEEDEHNLKIILDVNEFVGGDVKVEVVDEKEIVVEGEAAREEGTSTSTLSFRRVFTLPRVADVSGISSAMSSDGVLTITTPKLQQLRQEDSSSAKTVVTESQSRVDSQDADSRSWEERSERQESKESEGCSSRKYTSSYQSQHQYSSDNTF